MTEELFRSDAYVRSCQAEITAIEGTSICLDRTVFYPLGGGQPGDTGSLTLPDGAIAKIVDTQKGSGLAEILPASPRSVSLRGSFGASPEETAVLSE